MGASSMHDYQHNTTMSVQFSSSLSQRPIFIFVVVADVMSNYLTTDGLKKFSVLPEAPLRPEARGICHICHMVNPALPVKEREKWGTGVVICLERGADLHMAQLMPLPLTVSCSSNIQIGFTILVTAHPCSPGQRAVKRVCM